MQPDIHYHRHEQRRARFRKEAIDNQLIHKSDPRVQIVTPRDKIIIEKIRDLLSRLIIYDSSTSESESAYATASSNESLRPAS